MISLYLLVEKYYHIMKSKPHWLTIITFLLLLFSLSYLETRLICAHLFVDAAFALVAPVLFGLMIYFMRKGK